MLAARRTNKHQDAVVENLQHAACLVVAILTVDVVLLELVCAVGIDREYGLDARAVGCRQCALVCAGNGSEVEVVSATLVESVFASLCAVFLPLQDTIIAAAKTATYIRFLFIPFIDLFVNCFLYRIHSNANGRNAVGY